MTPLILLDRDGIINHDSPFYVKGVDELVLIPESVHAIARLTATGYQIGVATNQSGVSRGLYTETELLAMHQKMKDVITAAGGRIDAVRYCIHLPEQNCSCRKPQPGMLHALAAYFKHSLAGVPFVGDRVSDILAARAAGATPIMVLSAMTERGELKKYPEVPIYHSLAQYVDELLASEAL